jgi:hypothetical protein
MSVDVRPTERRATRPSSPPSAADGFERVLGWGGDGTLNEVIRGLVGTETALGVLPGGTVNVFAREVGIPRSIEEAAETFVTGEIRRIPVGIAADRPFLLMTGVGLDAEVVRRLKTGFKHALGAAAFWLDGFRMLASYPMPTIRIRSEGREVEGSGLIAGKIRRYGPRYVITPARSSRCCKRRFADGSAATICGIRGVVGDSTSASTMSCPGRRALSRWKRIRTSPIRSTESSLATPPWISRSATGLFRSCSHGVDGHGTVFLFDVARGDDHAKTWCLFRSADRRDPRRRRGR